MVEDPPDSASKSSTVFLVPSPPSKIITGTPGPSRLEYVSPYRVTPVFDRPRALRVASLTMATTPVRADGRRHHPRAVYPYPTNHRWLTGDWSTLNSPYVMGGLASRPPAQPSADWQLCHDVAWPDSKGTTVTMHIDMVPHLVPWLGGNMGKKATKKSTTSRAAAPARIPLGSPPWWDGWMDDGCITPRRGPT
ncbi:hypothetical protein CSAL01_10782 [Colletotrichum salicis]|uniref:Uncharacterized protein n=1 Tax=Colletotrichum salicis TaxID=1209931 RepID=A0A135T6G2_9PEZI|nr:hypothetical protein CSAL01_10782 [Colletotrichum salicis]